MIDYKIIMKTSIRALLIYMVSLLLFPFGFIVLPSCFIKLGLKNDNINTLMACGLFFILAILFSNPTIAIVVMLFTALVTFSILNLIKAGFSDKDTYMISFAGIVGFVVLTSIFLKIGTDTSIPALVSNLFDSFLKSLSKLNLDKGFQDTLIPAIKSYSEVIIKSTYSIIGVVAFFTSVLNVYISQDDEKHRFDTFRLDKSLVIAAIVLFGVAGFVYFVNKPLANYLMTNFMVFFVYSFMLAGISVFLYHLRSLSKPYKVLAILITVLIQPLDYIYAIIGAVDCFKDLRNSPNRRKRSYNE